MLKITTIESNPKKKMRAKRRKKTIACKVRKHKRKAKLIRVRRNPEQHLKKGDIVKIYAPGLPGHGKTGRILGMHGDHFQIESGPGEYKNYMHPATRLTKVKRNPRGKYQTIITGLVKTREKRFKTYYFTGKSFVRNKAEAKIFPGSTGKQEAKRILQWLPPQIESLSVERI